MLRFLTAGESHGRALVVIVEGLPAGLPIEASDIADELARRRLGYGRGPRMRFEADEITLVGGIRHGRTLGTQLALVSQINLQGLTIDLAPNAAILAPSANVALSAGMWNLTGAGATAVDTFAYTTGQIYVDTGATLDVAGSAAVPASVTENIVSVQLLGTELAGLDSGGQREIRRKIGFIFQDHNLFDALSAFQTLSLAMEVTGSRPPRAEARRRASTLRMGRASSR